MKTTKLTNLLASLATLALVFTSSRASAATVFTDGFDTTDYPSGGTAGEFLAKGWTTVLNIGNQGMGVGNSGGTTPPESTFWGNAGSGEAALEYNYTNAPINCGDIVTISSTSVRLTVYTYIREIILWDGVNAGSRVTVANLTDYGYGLGQYATYWTPTAKDNIPSLRYVCAPADAGKYVIFKYGHGATWSETADVTFDITPVTTPVFLTQPPTALERSVGETATLAVEVAGCNTTYQWKKGVTDIVGETSPTLTLTALTTAANGSYTCVASNGNSVVTTTSTACQLTVVPQLGGGACLSLGINFSRRDGGLGGGNAPASWYPNPTAPAYGLHQSRWQTAVSGNAAGGPEMLSFGLGQVAVTWTATSTYSMLESPTTVVPGNEQVNYGYLNDDGAGNSVTITGLTNTAGGAGFTTYVVRTIAATDNGTSFTNNFLTDNETTLTQPLTYTTVVAARSNPSSGIASISADSTALSSDSITLNSITGGGSVRGTLTAFIITDKPVLVAQPQTPPNALYTGSAFSIAGDAFGVPPLAYQWQKNGTNVPGATSATYSVGSASTNDSGSYAVTVTNAYGSVTSTLVAVSVSGNFSPVINTAPANRTAYVGGKATFSVVASGGSLSYQWKKGGIAGTPIANATNATLALTGPLGFADDSDYTVTVSNNVGTNNATAHLTVLALPSASTYLGMVLSDSPVTLWRLGEASGTTAVDAWGANDAAYSGSVTLGTAGLINGDANTAITLVPTGKAMAPFASDLNNPAGPFSVEFWAQPTTGGQYCLISSQNRTGSRAGFTIFMGNGGPGFSALIGNNASGTIFVNGATPYQVGVQQHVVVSYDGTTVKVYVNGVLDASAPIVFGTDFNPNTVEPFQIGARNGGDGFGYNGVIDDVAVYNYALTPAQVQNHADQGLPPKMVALTPVTGIVPDTKPSGTPFHGANGATTTASTWAASDTDANTTTRIGVAQFTAANNTQITVNGQPGLDSTNGTISFWVRFNGSIPGGNGPTLMDRRALSGGQGAIIAVLDASAVFVQLTSGAGGTVYTGNVGGGNWHHVAVTYAQDSGSTISVYIDGVLSLTGAPTDTAWSWQPGLDVRFGTSRDGWWQKFNGSLDDFRWYDRILDATEVGQLYTDALVDTAALKLRLNFDTAPVSGYNVTSSPNSTMIPEVSTNLPTFNDLSGALTPYLHVPSGNQFFRVRVP